MYREKKKLQVKKSKAELREKSLNFQQRSEKFAGPRQIFNIFPVITDTSQDYYI